MPTPALPPLGAHVDALLETPGPLPIVAAGDPVLRRTAQPYDGQLTAAQLTRLITAMRDTMHAAPGVGLAAPQIGVPLRIAVVEDTTEVPDEVRDARGRVPLAFRVLVNPSYEPVHPPSLTGSGRVAYFEGCLSVPGWQAVVVRYARVRLRAVDEQGQVVDEEFAGWPARIVQHETDHLNGTLYLDRAEPRSLTSQQTLVERWAQPTPHTAARELGFSLPVD